eukprot:TRINITY_DN4049_c0_g1_i3.p1 TRINITY_DN4049_c0_g1~~TRINITY_DN4049_c0_g1_i3.p1  ORF type:complete len:213 (-),score=38.41 TRINITY_DN4049_c0_g1_i3:389-1027(-)
MCIRDRFRLGVEICGVLLPAGDAHDQTSIYNSERPDEYLHAPLAENAERAMERLCGLFDEVFLVCNTSRFPSKFPPADIQKRVMRWLNQKDFFNQTGYRGEVSFCSSVDEKAVLCQDLLLTHMVDTNVRALEMLSGVVMQRYLMDPPFKPLSPQRRSLQRVPQKNKALPKDFSKGDCLIRAVHGWHHFQSMFIRTQHGLGEYDEETLIRMDD